VLTDVLSRLRPDPAEDLAKFVGDAPAERIAQVFRDAFNQMRDTAESLTRQGADYLVAENPMLLGRQEWETFRGDIAALESRLAALEERIDVLPSAAPHGPG
jgi:ubiquinone biosynthesis protein UbiJ